MTEQEIRDIVKKRYDAQRKKKEIQVELKVIGRIPATADYSSS